MSEFYPSKLIDCRACPRLVAWREEVAASRRPAYRDERYWGRPVPSMGQGDAPIVIVGLAPAAHGANRTGRMFTGDRSGDWLFRALHQVGLANHPISRHAGDGLELAEVLITAAVRCAPPANRPTPDELRRCSHWLDQDLAGPSLRVLVALGSIAFQAVLKAAPRHGWQVPRPRPRFGHGQEAQLEGGPWLLASYHPSQQNTFTGRLTQPMLEAVLRRARALADPPTRSGDG
ncbi:MAG TPA: uracil-DNA glycosylase [Acidimicrobiia bacterium]|nr:uracil-DNA glycosylase [Acidimicrobiia bacterium]